MDMSYLKPADRGPAAVLRVGACLVLVLLCALGLARAAHAAPAPGQYPHAMYDYEAELRANAYTPDPFAAGRHPDLHLEFMIWDGVSPAVDWSTKPARPFVQQLRSVLTQLPRGAMSNVRAVPTCARVRWHIGACPSDARVGNVHLWFPNEFEPPSKRTFGLWNMPGAKGEVARIGIGGGELNAPGAGSLVISVTPQGNYAVRTIADEVVQALTILGMEVDLWGVPGEHNGSGDTAPFFTNPTRCDTPMVSEVSTDTYEETGNFVTVGGGLGTLSGCDGLEFGPSVSVEPTSSVPGAATGLRADIEMPYNTDADEPVPSMLRDARVTLPEGFSINPSAANDLVACSDGQFDKDGAGEAQCPAGSKVGTVEVESPLLPELLKGDVYVGEPKAGNLYRLFVYTDDLGVRLKLEGRVDADPETGQLTTTFADNPELPFTRFTLKLRGGSRALLANPTSCGEHEYRSRLTPWSGGADAKAWDTISIDCPGLSGFSPVFEAGTTSVTGGSFSPFVMNLSRGDSDQFLSGVEMDLPQGLLAKIQGVEQCSNAAANAGSCPAASKVGSVMVGAGAGSSPFFLPGEVFFTEGYKGAPFGLAVKVRAIAGPYDLGTVNVRQALHINPDDATVKVVSDPFPTILEGIPLRLRSVSVNISRDGFMVNPTSCAAKQIAGVVSSTQGANANVGQRFQVDGCRALAFKPRLGLRLTGKKQRRPGGHPGLRAALKQPAGQAGIEQVKVKLPTSLALDPDNANGLCSYEDGLKADCPDSSRIGFAKATSPLLNKPLAGPVYFVESVRFDTDTGNRIRTLPTLLVKLAGEIPINLRATTSVSGKKLTTTFASVPDAPVTSFNLRLRGGNGGILAVTGERHLCSRSHTAIVQTDAHNGRRADHNARIKTPCANKSKRASRNR